MHADPASIDAGYARARIVEHATRRHRAAELPPSTPLPRPALLRTWHVLSARRPAHRATPPASPSDLAAEAPTIG